MDCRLSNIALDFFEESESVSDALNQVACACDYVLKELVTSNCPAVINGLDREATIRHYQDAAAAIRQLAEELEI